MDSDPRIGARGQAFRRNDGWGRVLEGARGSRTAPTGIVDAGLSMRELDVGWGVGPFPAPPWAPAFAGVTRGKGEDGFLYPPPRARAFVCRNRNMEGELGVDGSEILRRGASSE